MNDPDELKEKLGKTNELLDKLDEMLAEGEITEAKYKQLSKKYRAEVEILKNQIAEGVLKQEFGIKTEEEEKAEKAREEQERLRKKEEERREIKVREERERKEQEDAERRKGEQQKAKQEEEQERLRREEAQKREKEEQERLRRQKEQEEKAERERKAREEVERRNREAQKAKQEEEILWIRQEERKRIAKERDELKAGERKEQLPYKKLLILIGVLGMLLLGFWIINHGSTPPPAPIITSFEFKLNASGISPDTVNLVAEVIKNRLEILGIKNATIHKSYEKSSITIDLPSIFASEVMDIFREGKFEIRIQVQGNQTEHVLYGDQIVGVGVPQEESGEAWGVSFELSDAGAAALRDAAIKYGAVTNPSAHYLSMYLDNNLVFNAPLAPNLARNIQSVPVKNLVATTGIGSSGEKNAKELWMYLKTGALPVPADVKIVSSIKS